MVVEGHERLQRVEGWTCRGCIVRSETVLGEVGARRGGAGELRSELRDGEIVGVDLGAGDPCEHFFFKGGFVVDAETVDGDFAVWVDGLRFCGFDFGGFDSGGGFGFCDG